MKLLPKMVILLSVMLGANAFAESDLLDLRSLNRCSGTVELREAGNGDLAIKLENINYYSFDTITITDSYSGRILGQHTINATEQSFTLSKKQRNELSSDRRVSFSLTNSFWGAQEAYDIVIPQVVVYVPLYPPYDYAPIVPDYGVPTYQGPTDYNTSEPVTGSFVPGVTHQKSKNGNCKIMIYGKFSGKFAPGQCN